MSIVVLLLVLLLLVIVGFAIYIYKAKAGGPLDWSPQQIADVYNWARWKATRLCTNESVTADIANKYTKYASMFWNYSDFDCIIQKPETRCPSKIISKLNEYLAEEKCKPAN